MTGDRASVPAGRPTARRHEAPGDAVDRVLRVDIPLPLALDAPPEALVEAILRDGIVGSADPSFAVLFGCSPSKTIEGRRLADLEGFWMTKAPERLVELASRGFEDREIFLSEIDASGEHRTKRVRLKAEIDDEGLHALWCFERDVAVNGAVPPPMSAEEERRITVARAARLTALDEMTSGIAHELNQPLAAIVNYANGCIRRLERDGVNDRALNDALESIVVQSRRAAEIVRLMRSCTRRTADKREPHSLSTILRSAIDFAAAPLERASVHVETHFVDGHDEVVIDSGQITQVTIHLLNNAVDALETLPEGRTRTIRVETRIARDESSRPMVEVDVVDSANGLSDVDAPRIFEPFYTTRDHGLGLGLTASRAIIESHGGQLRLCRKDASSSETRFRFTLPLRQPPSTP
ncbi:MAG: ATP-binding protein [Planctomycetota bacterium]